MSGMSCPIVPPTTPFKLVLDYDGVVFKNPYAMEMVSRKSAEYVSNKLNMSYANARVVNSTRYKVHGHTVKYLNDVGVKATLEEYNDFVFGDLNWEDLQRNIMDADYDPIIDILLLNNIQKQKCVLFSNAPRIWVDNTLKALGTDQGDVFETMFTCETLDELKPSPKLYDDIESCYPEHDLLFIDDSILNIHGLGSKWKTHWFKPTEDLYKEGCNLMQEHGYIDKK